MNCIQTLIGHFSNYVCRIDWNMVTALSSVALAGIALATLVLASTQLKEFLRDARIKRLIDLVSEFERPPYADYRRELASSRVDDQQRLRQLDSVSPPFELYEILNFFEHIGYLWARDYLRSDGLFYEFHYWIFHIYADALTVVKHEQEQSPIYYKYLARLHKRLVQFQTDKGQPFRSPTTEEIISFYQQESRLLAGSQLPRKTHKPRKIDGR